MRITELTSLESKLRHRSLLLCSDPSEQMLLRYLHRGRMFLLEEEDPLEEDLPTGEALGAVVAVSLGEGVCEIKNLAIAPAHRGMGCGRMLVEHVVSAYEEDHSEMLAGVRREAVPLFERMGFTLFHLEKGYYTAHYPEAARGQFGSCPDLHYMRRMLWSCSAMKVYHLPRRGGSRRPRSRVL